MNEPGIQRSHLELGVGIQRELSDKLRQEQRKDMKMKQANCQTVGEHQLMMAQRRKIEQAWGAYVGGRAVRGRGDGARHDGAAARGGERGGAALAPAASEGRWLRLLLPLRWRGGRGPCAERERAPLSRRCVGRGTESGHGTRISTARTPFDTDVAANLSRCCSACSLASYTYQKKPEEKKKTRQILSRGSERVECRQEQEPPGSSQRTHGRRQSRSIKKPRTRSARWSRGALTMAPKERRGVAVKRRGWEGGASGEARAAGEEDGVGGGMGAGGAGGQRSVSLLARLSPLSRSRRMRTVRRRRGWTLRDATCNYLLAWR